jgi:N-acetylmuramoyl-L-alanine amidase
MSNMAGNPAEAKAVSNLLKTGVFVLLAVLCGSCALLPGMHRDSSSAIWRPSANYNKRGPILVVIHATEQDSVQASLDTLRSANAQGPVSAHYLVGKDGHVYQLVSESRRAWHAGGGSWGNVTDLNSASIGIELDNDGHSDFPDAQIHALVSLLREVCDRQGIPYRQVIAHADLAPARKTDPGVRFPWQQLAQAGFGRWPTPETMRLPVPAGFDAWLALRALGYRMNTPQAALRAFRLHFRGIDDAVSPPGPEDRQILYSLMQQP